jgi:hypothetical protein
MLSFDRAPRKLAKKFAKAAVPARMRFVAVLSLSTRSEKL